MLVTLWYYSNEGIVGGANCIAGCVASSSLINQVLFAVFSIDEGRGGSPASMFPHEERIGNVSCIAQLANLIIDRSGELTADVFFSIITRVKIDGQHLPDHHHPLFHGKKLVQAGFLFENRYVLYL